MTDSKMPQTPNSDVTPKHVGEDTLDQKKDNIAKVSFDRVKEAMPSAEAVAGDIHDYVRDHTDLDMRRMADDAAMFVRRNPVTSLAAAAGVGILIGVLASKRS